ncbi:hypothetical protein [Terasakiella pusilla]|uniref:hypothetical protein n=1 Tax=Terasakiella pusilla TaxID=64973 RepID=UPI003AA9C5EB
MIFVYQDQAKIPNNWLEKVAKIQAELEKKETVEERKAFIDANSGVWGDIKDELLEMSHGKCWYSEAPDAVSDWHVDHFRPKKRALDEDKTQHEGYHWLAFDWMNYRIAGSFPNSPHKDGEDVTRGKWDYFPLANGSVRANWEQRDIGTEVCLLLDPTKRSDPKLIAFDENGIPIPSQPDNPIVRKRVETTVHFLFLDSPRLIAARKRKWRETADWIEELREACPPDIEACTPADYRRFERLIERLSDLTGPETPYAATARACLRTNGLGDYVKQPEESVIDV